MTLHFLNDVVNDIESTQKSTKKIIIAGWNSESAFKLINRIPGLRLLILSLPGSALIWHIDDNRNAVAQW